MTLAHFKLESFTGAPSAVPEVAALPDPMALEAAFADGLAEGMTRKEDEQIRTLAAGLDRLATALGDDATRREMLRREAVAALTPILDQVLDCLAPAASSARLETALHGELARLSRLASPVAARINCGPHLRGLVERCVSAAGVAGIVVTETDEPRISLMLEGGRVDVSPETMAIEIRRLIDEIKGEEATWTN